MYAYLLCCCILQRWHVDIIVVLVERGIFGIVDAGAIAMVAKVVLTEVAGVSIELGSVHLQGGLHALALHQCPIHVLKPRVGCEALQCPMRPQSASRVELQ